MPNHREPDHREPDHRDDDQLEQYRQAAEDALQQLDWCIGFLHGIRRNSEARILARNRAVIRTHILKRPAQSEPV
jgi:hypothetical protein